MYSVDKFVCTKQVRNMEVIQAKWPYVGIMLQFTIIELWERIHGPLRTGKTSGRYPHVENCTPPFTIT